MAAAARGIVGVCGCYIVTKGARRGEAGVATMRRSATKKHKQEVRARLGISANTRRLGVQSLGCGAGAKIFVDDVRLRALAARYIRNRKRI